MKYKLLLDDKVTTYLMCLFSFSIPLGQKMSTFILVLWLILSLLLIKPKQIVRNNNHFLLLALYLVYVLSLFYTNNFSFKYFEQKASLLIFPLLFYLNTFKYDTKVIRKTLLYFVIGCTVSVIVCYLAALFRSTVFINNSIVFKPQVDATIAFLESSIKGGNYFYGNYFSVMHQTVYYAMFLCFAVSIVFFNPEIIKNKLLKILIVILLSIAIFQVSSRAGVATLIMVVLFYLYKRLSKRLFTVASALIMLVIFPVLLMLNPRLKNTAKKIMTSSINFHNEDSNSASLRLMTWDASLQIIKSHPPVFGVGVGDAYNVLKEEYRKKRYVTPYKNSLNSHNQYFQLLVECGILGFVLFVCQLVFLIKESTIKRETGMLVILFFAIISFNSLFESIFNHYSGIMFYSFFFCLLTANTLKNTEAL